MSEEPKVPASFVYNQVVMLECLGHATEVLWAWYGHEPSTSPIPKHGNVCFDNDDYQIAATLAVELFRARHSRMSGGLPLHNMDDD